MAFGFTRTLPTLQGSHTDFPVLLDEGAFPAESVDGGATSILNGGGNLRAYTNSGKGTPLALEVVSFNTGVTPSIEVWVKLPVAYTGVSFYLEADEVETTQPPVTSPTGRNSVWSSFYFVTHDVETDSKGVNNAVNVVASNAQGKVGACKEFNGLAQYVEFSSAVLQSNDFSIAFWEYSDNTFGYFFSDGNDVTNIFERRSSPTAVSGFTGEQNWAVNIPLAETQWNRHVITNNPSGDVKVYINGAEVLTFSGSNFTGLSTNMFVANRSALDRSFRGRIDEFEIYNSSISADRAKDEYDNQDAPSVWGSSTQWSSSGGISKPLVKNIINSITKRVIR